MLQLQPMTNREFLANKSFLIEDYAKDIAANYHIFIGEAR